MHAKLMSSLKRGRETPSSTPALRGRFRHHYVRRRRYSWRRDQGQRPLAYCTYLKNVRIAQRWEDGKKRRYRLNSACCWIRSSIADPGAGPSVIGNNLMHALPPDAVVSHTPHAPRIGLKFRCDRHCGCRSTDVDLPYSVPIKSVLAQSVRLSYGTTPVKNPV